MQRQSENKARANEKTGPLPPRHPWKQAPAKGLGRKGGLGVCRGVCLAGGFGTRIRGEHLCSSLASLGRARVGVSSKLILVKEGSWESGTMAIPAQREVSSRRERGHGLPSWGEILLMYASCVSPPPVPCLALCL